MAQVVVGFTKHDSCGVQTRKPEEERLIRVPLGSKERRNQGKEFPWRRELGQSLISQQSTTERKSNSILQIRNE